MLRVVFGPMFAGKTSTLLSRARQAVGDGRQVVVVNHASDTRGGPPTELRTHDGRALSGIAPGARALAAERAGAVALAAETDIFVDEGQFFDDVAERAEAWLAEGRDVTVASLYEDCWLRPFPAALALERLAARVPAEVLRLEAACAGCGRPARHTTRTAARGAAACAAAPAGGVSIFVGGSEAYRAACDGCWRPPPD